MPTPQPAIFTEGGHHYALEYRLRGHEDPAAIRAALASLPSRGSGGPSSPGDGGPHLLVAFGDALWRALAPAAVPDGLRAFETVEGPGGMRAPATQGDLMFWIHGDAIDEVFDAGLEIGAALSALGELRVDLRGFVYHDSRDLTGFVDGTANPRGADAVEAAVVSRGPGAGGTFVLSQRWVHDLRRFGALAVGDQERVIGRTKPDSVELSGDAMPADSHVSRTDVSRDGAAVKIYRRSFPYGTVGEHGLYFLAFACRLERFTVLLDSMFGRSGDGLHDRLLQFTRPVTGAYWFAPSVEDLREVLGR